MLRLDQHDRRILYELDRNSRASYAELARRLRMAPETVRYRVQRLFDDGVISNFTTIVDSGKLGFENYKVLLKLQSVTDAVVEKIVQFLIATPSVMRIMRFDGTYDLGMIVKVTHISELDALLLRFMSQFNQYVAKRSLSVNVWAKYLPRTFLSGKARKGAAGYGSAASSAPYKLDRIDETIVQLLSEDSRMSATEIAKKLPKRLSPFSVTQRIRHLERDQLVTAYSISLQYEQSGILGYKVLLYLHQLTAETAQHFAKYCQTRPNITYLVRSLGEWDFELNLEVEEPNHCREAIMDLTRVFPHLIRDYSALLITKIDRYNFYPVEKVRGQK